MKILLAGCALILSANCFAQSTFEENGILYMEDLSDPSKLAVVVIPKNSPINPEYSLYSGSIIIPAYIEHDLDRYQVVGIAPGAFKGNNLEELIIEEGPTMVGKEALANTALRKLTYPGSLKVLSGTNYGEMEELNIGEGIVKMNNVRPNKKLRNMSFPMSLEVISWSDFNSLNPKLTLGPNISDISHSFDSGLWEELSIEGKSLGIYYSFSQSQTLESITLSSVNDIDTSFENCPLLTSVDISGKYKINRSFNKCKNLQSLNLDCIEDISWSFDSVPSLKKLTIPATCRKIDRSFRDCDQLEKIEIADGVRAINESFKVSRIKTLTIPESCKHIANSFWEADSLKILKIKEGVESIKDQSFEFTSNLRVLYVPSAVCRGLKLRGNKLEEVHFTSMEPPVAYPQFLIDRAHFSDLKIYVPKGTIESYRKIWKGDKMIFNGKEIVYTNKNNIEFIEE